MRPMAQFLDVDFAQSPVVATGSPTRRTFSLRLLVGVVLALLLASGAMIGGSIWAFQKTESLRVLTNAAIKLSEKRAGASEQFVETMGRRNYDLP